MKAAQIGRYGEPSVLRINEVDRPAPSEGEVLVQVEASSVNGHDVIVRSGGLKIISGRKFPLGTGLDFAGVVAATGPGQAGYRSGDRVWGTVHPRQRHAAGAAAEYVAVPAANVYRLPAGFDGQTAAMIEPLACAVHGLRRLGPVFGDSVLLTGAGTMGLLLLQLLVHAGAGAVTVVDRVSDRLEVASKLGAARVVSDIGELADERFEITVDATGVPAVIQAGSDLLDRGGRLLVFGVSPAEAAISLSPFRVYNDEITVTGSMAILRSFAPAVELLTSGVVDPRPLLSTPLPLEEFGEALRRVRAGQGIKWHIRPS